MIDQVAGEFFRYAFTNPSFSGLLLSMIVVLAGLVCVLLYRAFSGRNALTISGIKDEVSGISLNLHAMQTTQTRQALKIQQNDEQLREIKSETIAHKTVTAQQFKRIDESFKELQTQNKDFANRITEMNTTLAELVAVLNALGVTKKQSRPVGRPRK